MNGPNVTQIIHSYFFIIMQIKRVLQQKTETCAINCSNFLLREYFAKGLCLPVWNREDLSDPFGYAQEKQDFFRYKKSSIDNSALRN